MPYEADEDRRRRSDWVARRPGGGGSGLLLAGLAAVALGALAFYYLGPDLRRYIKIESM